MIPTAQIKALEERVDAFPGDRRAMRQLVNALETCNVHRSDLGVFGTAQLSLSRQTQDADWPLRMLDPTFAAQSYKFWIQDLVKRGITTALPFAQAHSGQLHKIGGVPALCGIRLQMFAKEGVISGLCNSCYKVQILPQDLVSFFQTYFLLLSLELPDDNARKCMIELREDVVSPYKGYIYCQSVEEAQACKTAFEQLMHKHGVGGVSVKISHGCSEYGLQYASFKYSEDPGAPTFAAPDDWEAREKAYFSGLTIPDQGRDHNNKIGVSLRDVMVFHTWVKYAELIGDDSCRQFLSPSKMKTVKQFSTRVEKQAAARKRQLLEALGSTVG